jgi:ATP-binding cassette subfamily B multidrug efflux pump
MQARSKQNNTEQAASKSSSYKSLSRAMTFLTRHKNTTLLAYSALLIAVTAQLAVPQFTQNMINAVANVRIARIILGLPVSVHQYAVAREHTTLEQIHWDLANGESLMNTAALIIFVLALTRGIFAFLQNFLAEKASQGMAFDLRNEFFSKIQKLPISYYDLNQTSQLMIRATDDIEKVRLFLAQGLILAVQGIILLIVTLIIEFTTNWRLTLAIIPTLPVALVVFMGFGAVFPPLFKRIQERLTHLNGIVQENLLGIRVVKSFTREAYEAQRFEQSATDLLRQTIKNSQILSTLFPLILLMAQIGQPILLYFGGSEIINKTFTFGEYQKFSLYLVYLFFPLFQLGVIIPLMAQASASAERIFEVLDARSDITTSPGAPELPPIAGHIVFEGVSFRYFNRSEPILKNLNLTVQPGQIVALLGATGSGKTTIINLIPRFYEASSGTIRIDGHDIRNVKLESLRSQIGIVLQETNLFSGTIRENIAFGRPDALLDQVMDAAKSAMAHDFIMELSQGYDTWISEHGTTLSGGQKQRIAIARTLLCDPRLLILDDSTSSVDFETEAQLYAALDNLMHSHTSIVIAHRISTVLNADQIIILDNGEIVAQGKHADLIVESPLYAEIFHLQLSTQTKVLV